MNQKKRSSSSQLIANPFIKKRNLDWSIQLPTTEGCDDESQENQKSLSVETAAVESGAIVVDNHLERFSVHLDQASIAIARNPNIPRTSIDSYRNLYGSNAGSPHGAHFVIHQHDHPVAGMHYDLRLQINETSSVSWAIMYGLPGDPNSVRLNRNATETRIHSLWNHLIETASTQTGSLLIWDTGTYSILPRRSKHAPALDPSSQPEAESSTNPEAQQQSLLHDAFANRKIRLRLHGKKLPEPYVIYLRLTKSEDATGRAKNLRPSLPRRSKRKNKPSEVEKDSNTDDSDDPDDNSNENNHTNIDIDEADLHSAAHQLVDTATMSLEDQEIRELEDEQVRQTNAYIGASNSIGSIYQRRWYLSLDRRACGLVESKGEKRSRWFTPTNQQTPLLQTSLDMHSSLTDNENRLSFPFYVKGRDEERSIITGRLGADILDDEGVKDFKPRMGWMPVLN